MAASATTGRMSIASSPAPLTSLRAAITRDAVVVAHAPIAPGEADGAYSSRIERFVRERTPMVWRTACRLGLQPADADDVAQRVMLIATKRLKDLVPGKERAFLMTVTLRVVDKFRRAERSRPEAPEADLPEVAVPGLDVGEIVDQRRSLNLLDRMLTKLPEPLREVVVLSEIEDFSHAEIAAIQGVPPGTVASRIRLARSQLLRVAAHFKLSRGEERR